MGKPRRSKQSSANSIEDFRLDRVYRASDGDGEAGLCDPEIVVG